MITEEKPPLDENLLMHYGIPGMKWGRRKSSSGNGPKLLPGARTSMKVGRKVGNKVNDARESWNKKSTAKKIAIGTAVVGGAAAAAFIMSKSGRTTVGSLVSRVRGKKSTPPDFMAMHAKYIPKKVADTPVRLVPSPSSMMAEAKNAGVRNRMGVASNRALTDKTWRDATLMKRVTKETSSIPSIGDISRSSRSRGAVNLTKNNVDSAELSRRLLDPNYVWKF